MAREFESKKGIYPGYKPNPPRAKGDEFTEADFRKLMGFIELLKRADEEIKRRKGIKRHDSKITKSIS